jgi:hypothetical protein
MPHRIGPSLHGARAAKDLLMRVQRVVRQAADKGEDVNLSQVHMLFVDALQDPRSKVGVQLALIQYIVSAMEGNVIDLTAWTPLARSDPSEAPPPQVRRY